MDIDSFVDSLVGKNIISDKNVDFVDENQTKFEVKTIIDFARGFRENFKDSPAKDEDLARFSMSFETKDDKVSYLDWKLIPFKGSYRKTISIKDLSQIFVSRNNLKQYIIYSAFHYAVENLNELESYVKKHKSLQNFEVPLPTMEDVASITLTTIFTNIELYSQMSFSKEKYEGDVTYADKLKPSSSTLNARMGKTLTEVKCAFSFYLTHDLISLYNNENSKVSLDIPLLKSLMNKAIKENTIPTVEEGIPVLMLKSTIEALREVKLGLKDLGSKNLCHVYIGKAGTGKTTTAINESMNSSGNVVIALSNTVALNGMTKARLAKGNGSDSCVAASIQLARVTMNLWKDEWNALSVFCIDEFSQWSMCELDVLRKIVNLCKTNGKKLVIMGDINQIPSFLGFGSLLHSIISDKELGIGSDYLKVIREKEERTKDETYCSNIVTVKLRNHRAKSKVNICEMNTIFLNDGTIGSYNNLSITLQQLLSSFSEPTSKVEYGVKRMYVTGSNNQVMDIQRRVLENVMGRPIKLDLRKGILENLELQSWMVKTHNKIPVRCNKTISMESLSEKFKKAKEKANELSSKSSKSKLASYHEHRFIRNEQFYAWYGDNNKIHIASFEEVSEGNPVKMVDDLSFETLCEHFELNYAITVNKAQGLEWDNVIVVAGNLPKPEGVDRWSNYNLTSTRESMYVSMSRFKNSGHIFIGDAGKYPIKRTKLINNFSSVDFLDSSRDSSSNKS